MAAEVFAPDILGGAGRWCHEVARHLVKRGNRVTLILRRMKSHLPEKEIIDGIRVYRYGSTSKTWLQGVSCFIRARAIINSLCRNETFDLCHVQQPLSGFIAQHASSRFMPFVYSYFSPWHQEFLVDRGQNTSPGLNPGYWIRFALERMVVKKCRKLVVLSSYSVDQIKQFHRLQERCIKIPGGIDMTRFSPAESRNEIKQALGFSEYPFLLFCVRNLRNRMGLVQLIEAISIVKEKISGIHCIIAGRGPLKHDLEAMITNRNLQAFVTLAGEVSEEQLSLYYQAADLFVLPTQDLEGFGLVTVEALASGTPVVATPVGANVEVVGEFDKRLLTNGTQPEELAQGILSFHEQNLSKTFTAQVCREYAGQFSWEQVTKRVEQCYHEVLETGKKMQDNFGI